MNENVQMTEAVPVPERKYSVAEKIIAAALLVVGFLYDRFVLDGAYYLGAAIAMVLMYAAGAVLVITSGKKLSLKTALIAVSGCVLSVGLIFTSNAVVAGFVKLYATVSYFISVYYAMGNRIGGGMFVFDAVKAVFVMPFLSLSAWFKALLGDKTGKKFKTNLLFVFCGLFCAIVPSAIVILLLCYDQSFTDLLNSISFGDIFSFIGDLIFAFIFAVVVFSDAIASLIGRAKDVMGEAACLNTSRKSKVLPAAAVVSFVLPLLVVYAAFFVSQWGYYVSAFTGKLPEGFIYSEYARSGFFNLCAVAAINAGIIILVELFAARPNGKRTVPVRIAALLMSLATLILISTAVAKMVMYIDMYGLTRLRTYTTVFMIFMAIGFILVMVSQFAKIKMAPSLFVLTAVTLLALTFGGVDGIIAKYNADAYLDGRLSDFDVNAARELSAEAVPHVLSLLDCDIDEKLEKQIVEYGMRWAVSDEIKGDVFMWNIPVARAKAAIDKYDAEYGLYEGGKKLYGEKDDQPAEVFKLVLVPSDKDVYFIKLDVSVITSTGKVLTNQVCESADGDVFHMGAPVYFEIGPGLGTDSYYLKLSAVYTDKEGMEHEAYADDYMYLDPNHGGRYTVKLSISSDGRLIVTEE